jgi:hypothetical protein
MTRGRTPFHEPAHTSSANADGSRYARRAWGKDEASTVKPTAHLAPACSTGQKKLFAIFYVPAPLAAKQANQSDARDASVSLESDDFWAAWKGRAVAMPAHGRTAELRIVSLQSETARSVFKFDSHSLFGVAGVLTGDAVGVGHPVFLDAELQCARHGCEKKNHSHFAFRGVLQWCIPDWDRSAEFSHGAAGL